MEAATAHVTIASPARFRRTITDERLVERMRAGDDEAFEALYDRYYGGLLAFCRHMLGSREEAEDVLQHAFVAAHRQLLDPDRDINVRPWLYAVARNRCLSVLRARRDVVALDHVAEPEAAGLAVAAEVEHRQDLKDLLSDIARLPDDQRAALLLAELEALSHDEIAELLDVRRDKVKALVFQARTALVGWREARHTDCEQIREQLATVRGAALRTAPIRRHLDICDDCRAFRDDVRRQRAALAVVLPVVPSAALKQNVLGGALATSNAGAVAGSVAAGAGVAATAGGIAVLGGGGGGIAALGSGLVAKGLAVAAVAGGLGGGGYVAVHGVAHHSVSHRAPGPGDRPDRSATHGPTPRAALPPTSVAHGNGPKHAAVTPPRDGGSSTPSGPSTATSPVAPTGGAPPSNEPSTAVSAPAAPSVPTPATTDEPSLPTEEPHGRGPVQPTPGEPVRRGPVEESNGRGPPPYGTDRGNPSPSSEAPGQVKKG